MSGTELKMGLRQALIRNRQRFGLVLSVDYRNEPLVVFDIDSDFQGVDVENPGEFNRRIQQILRKQNAVLGIGGYCENRRIYKSDIFSTNTVTGTRDRRTVHMAVDLWVPEGTEVLAPIQGRVFSIQNNVGKGDYGPTLILEHNLDGFRFFTLYGHLTMDSLNEFDSCVKGDIIARVGTYPSNGNWAPHLHFQIISDMHGLEGDFPGVVSPDDVGAFRKICPDPNLILQVEELGE